MQYKSCTWHSPCDFASYQLPVTSHQFPVASYQSAVEGRLSYLWKQQDELGDSGTAGHHSMYKK
ncbi:GM16889 [Drosophila sechellia]|uniref:GM16889 n=1 Tax=Drosophila sechellia TaxID=7238 RepID=B4IIP2_DROSE|nr:GM16889 [Drosophila sechellia]